jgi:hypothetical protein
MSRRRDCQAVLVYFSTKLEIISVMLAHGCYSIYVSA